MKIKASTPLKPKRAPGRPRQYVIEEALDKAADIFCERGYNATSVGELAQAMGLVTGSIYKAFKDKHAVLVAAFERYGHVRSQPIIEILTSTQSGNEKLRSIVMLYINVSYGEDGLRGCLVVASAIELANSDPDMAERVSMSLRTLESTLTKLINEGQLDGSISPSINAEAGASMMLCFLQGLRVIGKTKPTREALINAADLAMSIFN